MSFAVALHHLHKTELGLIPAKIMFVNIVLFTVVFLLFFFVSSSVYQKNKELEIENQRKEKLLKMTADPKHGVDTGGEPRDPQAKQRRDFVKNVSVFVTLFSFLLLK